MVPELPELPRLSELPDLAESSEPIVLSELDAEVREAVAATRRKVAALHAELPRWGLVVWTAGNVSERVTLTRNGETVKTDLFVIKPSGVSYDELAADTMVVCTLDGNKIDDGTPASLTPSSDTAAHAYVYRHMDGVGGVVHTHSTYATAWAARREPIPCALTMMGDEFGAPSPSAPSHSSATTPLGAASWRPCPARSLRPCSWPITALSPSGATPVPPSRPPPCARRSPAPFISPAPTARSR